jgi:hypothetical protein
MSQPGRLTFALARQLAKAAGACDVATVTSYLVHCTDDADAANAIEAIRRHQPQLFRRAHQGRAR